MKSDQYEFSDGLGEGERERKARTQKTAEKTAGRGRPVQDGRPGSLWRSLGSAFGLENI